MKKLFWIFLVLGAVFLLGWWQQERIPVLRHLLHHEESATQYMCPMHPQIVRDKPGKCPICGMTLIPIPGQTHEHQHPEGSFFLTPDRRQSIGIKTAEVVQKPIHQEIRLPGRVAFDQELYVTEKEYVEALKLGGGDEVLQTIEKKLKRLGTSEEEFKKLRRSKQADESLFLPRDKGSLWIYASIYEADLSWITKGMKAEIKLPSNSNVSLEGEVKQIEPIIDPMTRTTKARIFVSSSSQILKPETYVDVILKKDMGNILAIPTDAVMDTGVRQVVFVDLGEGYLEPREVELGTKADKDYPIVKGLVAGEKVITSAHFLLDSESQIQAALKKFGEAPKEHHH